METFEIEIRGYIRLPIIEHYSVQAEDEETAKSLILEVINADYKGRLVEYDEVIKKNSSVVDSSDIDTEEPTCKLPTPK